MKRLFFDLETAPNVALVWRTGYKLVVTPESIVHERAIICVSWKWEGKDEIHNLRWDKNQCDKKLLERFVKELNKADEIIAHNGDRFDVKWVRARCIFHDLDIPNAWTSVDTLKFAKTALFNSNKLDYLAKFLKVGGKIETGGYDLWRSIVLDKCNDSLKHMVKYCDNDVLILERVWQKLQKYVPQKTHLAVLKGGEKWHCPKCTSEDNKLNRTYTTSAGTIKRAMKCMNCGGYHTISNSDYTKSIQEKIDKGLI
jgi:hypothetical protein